MHILSEKEFEDILVLHPELIEEGLTLIDRQAQLETKRTDLTFSDKDGKILLVELKKDVVTLDNVNQIKDYVCRLTGKVDKEIRAIIIGQKVPPEVQIECKNEYIEWKEIEIQTIFNYLQRNNKKIYNAIFIEEPVQKALKFLKI